MQRTEKVALSLKILYKDTTELNVFYMYDLQRVLYYFKDNSINSECAD